MLQSVHVQTTESKLASSNGSVSAAHRGVDVGRCDFLDPFGVVTKVETRAEANLEDVAGDV